MGFASAKKYPVAKYLNNWNKKSFAEKAREKKLRFWLKKLTGVAEAWSRLLLTKKKKINLRFGSESGKRWNVLILSIAFNTRYCFKNSKIRKNLVEKK